MSRMTTKPARLLGTGYPEAERRRLFDIPSCEDPYTQRGEVETLLGTTAGQVRTADLVTWQSLYDLHARALTVVLEGWRAAEEDESSWPVDLIVLEGANERPQGFLAIEARVADRPAGNESQEEGNPVADFYAPVEYTWSDLDFEVSKAVQQYSESVYADR